MSKTDKTRPIWVKIQDGPQWHEESHDHRLGVCDIDTAPWGWQSKTHCKKIPSTWAENNGLCAVCSPSACGHGAWEQAHRRGKKRSDKQRWKQRIDLCDG